jgi:hypothetical protein
MIQKKNDENKFKKVRNKKQKEFFIIEALKSRLYFQLLIKKGLYYHYNNFLFHFL